AAVAPDRRVEQPVAPERGGERSDAGLALLRVDTPEPRVQLEVAPPGQGAVDDRLLEDDARDAPGCERLLRDVEARQSGRTAGWPDRRREHADRRRLAGAVGPEQAEHLACPDLEVDRLHGFGAVRIGLAETGD